MDVDLNCDLGEGGAHDAELLALVTSANVSCGIHAGDPETATAALALAARHGVRAGAHPSFPDRAHCGRREMERAEPRVFEDCVYQVGALIALGRSVGCPIHYIKPHGALYHQACRDDAYARPLVAVAEFFGLPLLALPASRLQVLSEGRCPFIAEGFADRRYEPDGTLVPRSRPNAFVTDPRKAVEQVEWLLRERGVQSVCVHGDNPEALAFVRALRAALAEAGHRVVAL